MTTCIDDYGNEWIINDNINNNVNGNTCNIGGMVIGFDDSMKVPSYTNNTKSTTSTINDNIEKSVSVVKEDEKNDVENDDDNISVLYEGAPHINSSLKTRRTKRLITFVKGNGRLITNKSKFSGMTYKQAKYHNDLIDVLLKKGFYKVVYDKFIINDKWDFTGIDDDELELLIKFDFIEPELLHNCYVDLNNPD